MSDDIVPYTAPLERRGDLDSSTDTWPLQAPKEGDSSLLFSATINQKNVPALTAPNTNSNSFLSSPNNINNNDKVIISEATTSETGLLLASNTNCRSSSADDDSTTLESSREQQQMAAGQRNPTEKRNFRWRRRRQRRWGENSVVVPPPTNACPAPLSLPLSLPPPPSTQQPQNAQNPPPHKAKKKKNTTDPPNLNDPSQPGGHPEQQPPPTPSSADLNWSQEMYPLLFRIPTDGYTEGGYNPTCITKTDGLLPLGVCDSGSDEDVQGSARDFYGNQVDAGVFLDAVAFKLERCRLAPTLANSCQPAKSKFWCCKEFEVVVGVSIADICLQLAAVEGKFY